MREQKTAIEVVPHLLRAPDRMTAGDLVAAELMNAMCGDALGKIRHVCEAVMFLDDEERENAKIQENDLNEVKKVYGLAMAFQNVFIGAITDSSGNVIERSQTIQFPFSEKEAKDWSEWLDVPGIVLSRVKGEGGIVEEIYRSVQGKKQEPDVINALKSHFISKAMPKAAVWMKRTICLVSPESYKQMMDALRRKK